MKGCRKWTPLISGVTILTLTLTLSCRSRDQDRTPEYAKNLQPKLEALLADTLVPGAVVLVHSEEFGMWEATFGTREIGAVNPVSLQDSVRIGSNTKTMTGTLVLQLVQDGLIKLDAPVENYYPGVPNGAKITMAHLLSMRSGLPNYSNSLILNEALDNDPQKVWAPEELLQLAFKEPLLFEPGQDYAYSNTNTVILGLIVEKLTNQPLEVVMQERIFKPLGLAQTVFPALTSHAIPESHPRGYMYGTNVETIESQVLSEEQQAAARAGTFKPSDVTDGNPSWAWAAGSGIASAGDLKVFVEALAKGGLLTAAMQEQRMASIVPTDPAHPEAPGYGYALARMGPMYGHTGELPGFNSFMGHDPERKITIVTWTSLSASIDGRAPAVEMAKLIISELYGSGGVVKAPSAS